MSVEMAASAEGWSDDGRAGPAVRIDERPPGPAEAQFAEFVRARAWALQRTAFLLTGDRHLAEDLVQDALARTHRALRRLSDEGHYEAYARTVLYHLHISNWRRRRFIESLPGELADRARPDSDHADRTDLKVSLHQALGRLTRRQRAVLVLRFFEDRSEREAAELWIRRTRRRSVVTDRRRVTATKKGGRGERPIRTRGRPGACRRTSRTTR